MSRIVVFNQYFPPDTSATATVARDVVGALVAAGHRVTVVAGRPSYQPLERYPWRVVRREADDGIVVERVGSSAFSRHRVVGRVTNYVSYLALGLWRGIALDADAVIALTDPPLAVLPASVAARLRRRPLIYNIRDLHPDVAVAAGLLRPGLLVGLWDAAHRWALRRAARVVVLGDDMRRRVLTKGVRPDRVVVVRDGAPPSGPVARREHRIARELRGQFRFVVMHAGNLGFVGAWDTLLAAAARLQHEGVVLAFVGDGATAASVRSRAAAGNVRFVAPVPAAEVPELLAAADLQVVTVRRGLEGLVVPSKLYPILAARRAVLAVAPEESDVAAIVRETRCGWVADPDDPDAVARAVRLALESPAELAARAERAGAAARRFDRATLLRDFVRAVEDVL